MSEKMSEAEETPNKVQLYMAYDPDVYHNTSKFVPKHLQAFYSLLESLRYKIIQADYRPGVLEYSKQFIATYQFYCFILDLLNEPSFVAFIERPYQQSYEYRNNFESKAAEIFKSWSKYEIFYTLFGTKVVNSNYNVNL
jgi:hypothetical protein